MLKQLTLEFKVDTLENEYHYSLYSEIRNSLNVFLLLVILVGGLLSIYFAKYIDFNLGLGYCVLMVVFILISLMGQCIPQYCDILFGSLQLIIGIAGNIFHMVWKVEQCMGLYNYDYIALFQCLCHAYLFMQGKQFIYQFAILIFILVWYISIAGFRDGRQIIVNLQLIIIVSLFFYIRRNHERNRRKNFLSSLENQKWEQIIDQIMKKSIILVKFDTTQDQIVVDRMSHKFINDFNVQDSKDLRIIFRNISIKKCDKQDEKDTLEGIIRNMLNYKQTISMRHLKKSLYYNYIGFNKLNNQFIKIKLIDYFSQESKMVIVILQDIQIIEQSQIEERNSLIKCFQDISLLSLKLTHHLLMTNEFKKTMMMNYVFATISNIWLNSNKILSLKNQIIEIPQIISILEQTFKGELFTQLNLNTFTLNSSKISVITILVILIQYLNQLSQLPVKLIIQKSKIQQIDYYIFSIFHQCNYIPLSVQQLLTNNIYFYGSKHFVKTEKDINLNQNKIHKLLNSVNLGDQIKDNKFFLTLGLSIIKYLLVHFGISNKIEMDDYGLYFTLIDFKT